MSKLVKRGLILGYSKVQAEKVAEKLKEKEINQSLPALKVLGIGQMRRLVEGAIKRVGDLVA